MKAMITDIKRFAVHDGDGIRTTVFLKGCPLRCVWCHNPEGLQKSKQLAYFSHKCVGCGACTTTCGAHTVQDGTHTFDRAQCIGCGRCVDDCPSDALKLYGKEMTVQEVLDIVVQDKAFYLESGGGVTLSGGECLLYADFCAELLCKCKENGISTAVDTCGFVAREQLQKVVPYTDIFLYDIKAIDGSVHKICTGAENGLILDNLLYLDAIGCKTEIRVPDVPGWNDGEIAKIEQWVKQLKNMTKLKILPYHDFAKSKYLALGMPCTLP